MKWTLTPLPPLWYMVFWVVFQTAFWLLAWWLGPRVIARGLSLYESWK